MASSASANSGNPGSRRTGMYAATESDFVTTSGSRLHNSTVSDWLSSSAIARRAAKSSRRS